MSERSHSETDIVVVGGGPAGAAAGGLLASWGYSVLVLARPTDPAHGLANSLPPSTRKLLQRVYFLDLVERVGYRTAGNTVWWGDDERVEPFAAESGGYGYQVFRPDLDPLLLERASHLGARVVAATVGRVVAEHRSVLINYRSGGQGATVRARMALDCSGRAGVIARQGWRRPADCSMQALVGSWRRSHGWPAANETHTRVETYEDGWAWAVPISPAVRHVGVMIHGAHSRLTRGQSLEHTYRVELAKSQRMPGETSGALLENVWACDASLYASHRYAGPGALLVGDAASTIDPLSSFGVKKALASAWLAAITAHTRLRFPERDALACAFFSHWEEDVYATNLSQSRNFALDAYSRHPSPFWESRAGATAATHPSTSAGAPLDDPAVRDALEHLRSASSGSFARNDRRPLVVTGIVRDHEIVPMDAVPLDAASPPVRYHDGVDLVALADLAPTYTQVPDLFDAYCRRHSPVSLGGFLGSLSLLIARNVLTFRSVN